MPTVQDFAQFLESFAPAALAESWDNVGLLVGDRSQSAPRVMTCLTITPASAAEAVERQANLIVTHHPLPFREFRKLTSDTPEGRILLDLIANRIAIYSPHTAFDSAAGGINQQLATGLGLMNVAPLCPKELPTSEASAPTLGSGRFGRLAQPQTLAALAARLKRFLALEYVQAVGNIDRVVASVAVACGAAGEFLKPAREAGCDVLITGETRFHTCLEAEATETALLLTGHYASERFAVEQLATVLSQQFPQAKVWASGQEADPLVWL